MAKKYDLVCIGDVVMDAFIGLEEASVSWDKHHENRNDLDAVCYEGSL